MQRVGVAPRRGYGLTSDDTILTATSSGNGFEPPPPSPGYHHNYVSSIKHVPLT